MAAAIVHAAPALQPAQLAVVINDDEPNSVELGEYYRTARGIPDANIVHVRIPGKPRKLTAEQFAALKAEIDGKLKPDVQAVLMVWTAPYAVECNGITAAYALGYDAAQCIRTCAPGKASPYFNASTLPGRVQPGMRLAMLLPTESVEEGKALIDRGKASGFRVSEAGAYYLVTSEQARNSRARFFPKPGAIPQRKLTIHTLGADALEGKRDIMIYQTGKARVPKLETLQFMPGALADHLTSTGGDLLGGGQMSSLQWLQAGATASYGTVSEPCNFWQKFPNPAVLLRHYANGSTAIEAYWRSVAWPAQGVFIGEPLAAPYRR
ncbi:TIGR03790 family protein [Pseudoduganella sp. SL102]|uniref:TIGR03790 family protein n=1 Tax=Pseudoduganella sp. SL102 TaxID=2995154 RepID=UPI00248B06E3|nr:TIGR03790 family protein [Pseudoduganella sp. SL102]WBS04490.1 TIGR03790 family protein [Pseudoduganella sp. SL102]